MPHDDAPLRPGPPRDTNDPTSADIPGLTLSYVLRTYAAVASNRTLLLAATRTILGELGVDADRADEVVEAFDRGAQQNEADVYRGLLDIVGGNPALPGDLADQLRDALDALDALDPDAEGSSPSGT